MKVLFLDRDGIVNIERGEYTFRKQDFSFTENLMEFLSFFKKEGYEIILITNQGGIDKGLYTKRDVQDLHSWMLAEMKSHGIDVLDIFYCPHHDTIQNCLCRKPKSLLFEKSVAVYSIDISQSLMLGDNQRDIDSAEKIGIKGFLFESNPDWKNIKASELLP